MSNDVTSGSFMLQDSSVQIAMDQASTASLPGTGAEVSRSVQAYREGAVMSKVS